MFAALTHCDVHALLCLFLDRTGRDNHGNVHSEAGQEMFDSRHNYQWWVQRFASFICNINYDIYNLITIRRYEYKRICFVVRIGSFSQRHLHSNVFHFKWNRRR